MPVEQIAQKDAPCLCKIVLDGIAFFCVKKKRHVTRHRIEGPIEFTSSSTGLTVTIEHRLEWTEAP